MNPAKAAQSPRRRTEHFTPNSNLPTTTFTIYPVSIAALRLPISTIGNISVFEDQELPALTDVEAYQ